MMTTRSEREQFITNNGDIYEQWYTLKQRYSHVFYCPNSVYYRNLYDNLIRNAVQSKRVLEIGCGEGGYAERISSFGAAYVFAVDISQKLIANAQNREVPGKREYAVMDVSVPFEGTYDVIIGNAVLHHLDYQEVVSRLYCDNLSAGGMMFFYEPLGANLLIRLYHLLSKGAHTADERPFLGKDLQWLEQTFSSFRMIPVNYLSLPLGAISSFLFSNPDNVLLRAADRADRILAHLVPALRAHFRNAIFVLNKE